MQHAKRSESERWTPPCRPLQAAPRGTYTHCSSSRSSWSAGCCPPPAAAICGPRQLYKNRGLAARCPGRRTTAAPWSAHYRRAAAAAACAVQTGLGLLALRRVRALQRGALPELLQQRPWCAVEPAACAQSSAQRGLLGLARTLAADRYTGVVCVCQQASGRCDGAPRLARLSMPPPPAACSREH